MQEQEGNLFNRVNGFINLCQSEIKKTTAIGMKMISASKVATDLNESYRLLGKHTLDAVKNGELEWRDPKLKILMTQIMELEHALETHEDDVSDLKRRDRLN
jgi:hypothetical protein